METIKSFPNNIDTFCGAEDVMRWLHGRTSGVFGAVGNGAVTAVQGEMAVDVSDAIGWMSNAEGDGIVWWIDTEEETGAKLRLYPDLADGVLNRIDRVVVSWQTTDYASWPSVSLLKGVPSSTPTAPELTNDGTTRQISLARLNITAGSLSLTPEMLTDERLDPAVCGLVTDAVGIDTTVMQAQFEALLTAIEDELNSLNAGTAFELKRLQFENVTVPVAAFVQDDTYGDYSFRATVELEGVLESMTPEVIFSADDATSGSYAPVAACYTGGVYLYSTAPPPQPLIIPTVICWKAVS